MDGVVFSFVNVGIGFVVSWLLSHYVLPRFFDVPRCAKRSTAITGIYTVAALVRNVIVYEAFVLFW